MASLLILILLHDIAVTGTCLKWKSNHTISWLKLFLEFSKPLQVKKKLFSVYARSSTFWSCTINSQYSFILWIYYNIYLTLCGRHMHLHIFNFKTALKWRYCFYSLHLEFRKLRHKVFKEFIQDHTARKLHVWNLSPDGLIPEHGIPLPLFPLPGEHRSSGSPLFPPFPCFGSWLHRISFVFVLWHVLNIAMHG